jgi:hypothetical protein
MKLQEIITFKICFNNQGIGELNNKMKLQEIITFKICFNNQGIGELNNKTHHI